MDDAPSDDKTVYILDRLSLILSELDDLLQPHVTAYIAAAMAVLETEFSGRHRAMSSEISG